MKEQLPDKLTIEQAYHAMFVFIHQRYEILKSDELADMLSDMLLLKDKSPADPAIWHEWLNAIITAAEIEKSDQVKLWDFRLIPPTS